MNVNVTTTDTKIATNLKPLTGEELRKRREAALERYQWTKVTIPECMPELNGIFVGGCVSRGVGSSFPSKAHVHNGTGDPANGWICVRSLQRVGKFSERYEDNLINVVTICKPSRLLSQLYSRLLIAGRKKSVAPQSSSINEPARGAGAKAAGRQRSSRKRTVDLWHELEIATRGLR